MAVYPISDTGPAPVDERGILTKFVQIPCDNAPSETSKDVVSYQEKFKGPYSSAKEILSSIKVGDTITRVHTVITGYIKVYAAPVCPERNGRNGNWIVQSIRVQELEAGDHAILIIDYQGVYPDLSGATAEDIPEQDCWNLTWQAVTVSPWNFCRNDTYALSALSPSSSTPNPDWAKSANREYIEKAMGAYNFKILDNGVIVYQPVQNEETKWCLPAANRAIQKKVALQRNAIWHTPVLTHQTAVQVGSLSGTYTAVVGNNIDYIWNGTPDGCPYQFGDNNWTWVKTGDDMTSQKNTRFGRVTFTRRETWQGFPYGTVDQNYYGNGTFRHDENGIKNGRWPIEGI